MRFAVQWKGVTLTQGDLAIVGGSVLLLFGGVAGLSIYPALLPVRSLLALAATLSGIACLLSAAGLLPPKMTSQGPERFGGGRQAPQTSPAITLLTMVLAMCALVGFVGSGWLLLSAPSAQSYMSDVIGFTHINAEQILAGHNPYVHDAGFAEALQRYPRQLLTPLRRGLFQGRLDYPSLARITDLRARYLAGDPAARAALDPRDLHSYPALAYLFYAAALALGLRSLLWVNYASCLCLLIWLARIAPPGRRRTIALVAAASSLPIIVFCLALDTEMVCVALLLLAWHHRDHRWAGPILLGLACAFKQYCWFFAPFFLADRLREEGIGATMRLTLLTALSFLLPNLPFALAAPRPWFSSLWLPIGEPFFPFGQGIILLSTGHLLPYGPPKLYTLLELSALLGLLIAYARSRTLPRDAALLLPLLPLLLAYRSNANYFAFAPWLALYAQNNIAQRHPITEHQSPESPCPV